MNKSLLTGAVLGTLCFVCCLLLRRKIMKRHLRRELCRALLIGWIVFVCCPAFMLDNGYSDINLVPFKAFQMYLRVLEMGGYRYLFINVAGNVLLFSPVGFLLPLVLKKCGFWKAAAGGFLFSLFIELVQLLLPRCSDVDDLILNTLGAMIGYGIYALIKKWAAGNNSENKET